MTKRGVLTILLLLASSACVAALQWTETGWSAAVVSDYETGLPALMFNIGLIYDEVPDTMKLRIEWQVFSIEDGVKTVLYEYTKPGRERDAAERIYSASQSVLIEPGTQYGARVSIEDLINGLYVERDFAYFAPQSLSVGLRLVDWSGAQAADLSGMSDEELAELLQLQETLDTYTVLAEGVSVSSLFSQHANTDASYPIAVILLPETGVDNNWGTEDQPIIVTFGLRVLAFSIPTRSDSGDFLEQLETYDQPFTGTVYSGSDEQGFGRGVTVFLHDAMGVILDTAQEEQTSRTTLHF